MSVNVWAVVGTTPGFLPLTALTGTAGQILAMNAAATAAEWKNWKILSDQLQGPAGSAAAPSLCFTGALTTGFYRITSDQIGLSILGSLRFAAQPSGFTFFGLPVRMSEGLLQIHLGDSIVAAATTDLDTANGNTLDITNNAGNTVITSLGGAGIPAGTTIETKFVITGGTVTLTHNAVSLILFTGANINVQNGDVARWRKINTSATSWEMVSFNRGSGTNITLIEKLGDLIVGVAPNTASRGSAPPSAINCRLNYAVAAGALTITLKGTDNNDLSATNPALIPFRNVTPGTGDYTWLALTANQTFTISSGSKVFSNDVANQSFRLWIVGFNDGGVFRLGVINCLLYNAVVPSAEIGAVQIYPLGAWGIASSTAEGGAGTADASLTFYTASAVASKAYTVLGYATWETGLTVPGTWDAVPTRAQPFTPEVRLPGETVQVRYETTGEFATGTTTIPLDDTIPTSTEGDEYLDVDITPTSGANIIEVEAKYNLAHSTAGTAMFMFVLRETTTLGVTSSGRDGIANALTNINTNFLDLANQTTIINYNARAGNNGAGTTTFNGQAGARIFGGMFNSYVVAKEIVA